MMTDQEDTLIPFHEFRASLAAYVRKDEDGGVVDVRPKLLWGFVKVRPAAEAVEMLQPCDLAAMLSGVVVPVLGGKLKANTPEAEQFLVAIRERENGVEYERAIADALEQAAHERDLRPLLAKRDGVRIEEEPADEPEETQAPSEASSLFDSHEEGT